MPSNRHTLLLPALLLLSAAGIPSAQAMELVTGGFDGTTRRVNAPSDRLAASPADGEEAVLLDFTPRGAAPEPGDERADAPRLRFQLTVDGDQEQRFESLGLSASGQPSWLVQDPGPQASLTIGGALQGDGWSLGGGLSRSGLIGEGADLLTATFGYGPLHASLGYGQAETLQERTLDVLLFSTDLSALSWLALESDLALGTVGETESVAVGRVGVKLSF